ncbi:MAG TPA: Na+/H+ antiporter NhaA, partial [Panacibacter sp.]|nr:Na+/H+ antiporter NhaA [Panacibacter sp.]
MRIWQELSFCTYLQFKGLYRNKYFKLTDGQMKTKLFREFFNSEKAGGAILIFCSVISLFTANSFYGEKYLHFWHLQIAFQTVEYWINDGLMAIFFLLIGLE